MHCAPNEREFRMRFTKPSLIAILMLAASSAFAGPNLVVNGGFETGDLTGWTAANLNNTFVTSGV